METQPVHQTLLETISQHMPTDAALLPVIIAAILAGAGLLFMVKGARLAPFLAATSFSLVGGLAGAALAQATGLPFWPVVVICGTVGIVLGITLLKLWIAILVAGFLMTVGLGVYGHQKLLPALQDFQTRGLDITRPSGPIALPENSTEAADATIRAELAGVWDHLQANVPNLSAHLIAVAAATGLAGLVFGLLLPGIARAVGAATFGTALFWFALLGLLHVFWPQAALWLGQQATIILSVLWALSLLQNLLDTRKPKKRTTTAEEDAPASA